MTKYFVNCKTLDELKKAYKAAAMKYHPDMGGDTATSMPPARFQRPLRRFPVPPSELRVFSSEDLLTF